MKCSWLATDDCSSTVAAMRSTISPPIATRQFVDPTIRCHLQLQCALTSKDLEVFGSKSDYQLCTHTQHIQKVCPVRIEPFVDGEHVQAAVARGFVLFVAVILAQHASQRLGPDVMPTPR